MAERIFIIDDDPDIVEALTLVLEAQGYEVKSASSAETGVRLMPEVNPDLLVLDVMMETDTEGFHLAYDLRNAAPGEPLSRFSKIPILMLTAISQRTGMKFDPTKDEAFLPVDDFVEKPVRPGDLLAKVARLLKKE